MSPDKFHAQPLTRDDVSRFLDQLAIDYEQSPYWQERWREDQGDQHIRSWLYSLFDWLPA